MGKHNGACVRVGTILAGAIFGIAFLAFFGVGFTPGELSAWHFSPASLGNFGSAYLGNFAFAAGSSSTVSSTVTVGNAAPTVSNVVINGGSAITLTANTTQSVSVTATIADANGCADITGGTSTILLYRSSITSSTCLTTANNLNCYRATAFTATSTCSGGISLNTTTTFSVYYFADSTNGASSSYNADTWLATVIDKDASNATGTLDATGVELNVLTAINVTTSSINYGTIAASSTSAEQTASTTNAGNSTTTLQLYAWITLASGANTIADTNQHASTTTGFSWANGLALPASSSPATLSSFSLTDPTSTSLVSQATYWLLKVPGGTATGTYNGVTVFSSLWQP